MTWMDIALLIVFVVFIAVGAKMGSLWTGACLIGGFLGGFLVDYYTMPVSQMMGNIPAPEKVAGAALFLSGMGIALLPGWILSRLSSGLILGVVDSVFGLVTGTLAGLIAVTLIFLFVLPHAPRVEKNKAWRNSLVVKPLHHFIEDIFNDAHFQRESAMSDFKDDFVKDFTPVMKSAEKTIKSASDNLVKKIKKK